MLGSCVERSLFVSLQLILLRLDEMRVVDVDMGAEVMGVQDIGIDIK